MSPAIRRASRLGHIAVSLFIFLHINPLRYRKQHGTMKSHKRGMTMLLELQTATRNARASTGDDHIGTQITRGRVDVVRAVPPISGRGAYTVTVLRAGLTPTQAVSHLNAMR